MVHRSRLFILVGPLLLVSASCAGPREPPPAQAPAAPRDAAHEGITAPHGDHSPHHGGMVLMNGDLHFEVVFDPGGRHRVWFTDAIRADLPASVASRVTMMVARPEQAPEELTLAIDEAGESWVADGRPVGGENVTVTVEYSAQGEPYRIELPFMPAAPQ